MYLTINHSNIKPYAKNSSSSNQAFGMRQNITGPKVLVVDVIEVMLGNKRFNMHSSGRIDLCKAMTGRDKINPYEYPGILDQCREALRKVYSKKFKKIANNYIKFTKPVNNTSQKTPEEIEKWAREQARNHFPDMTIAVPKI